MPDEKRGSSDASNTNTNNRPPPNPQQDKDTNTTAPASNNNDENESLSSRIQKSASGLARTAFRPSAPPSSDAAHLLSDSTGKAGPASAPGSSSALAAAERVRDNTSGPSSSSASREQFGLGATETFRSQASSTYQSGGFEIPGLTEDEFQNTSAYSGDLSLNSDLDVEKDKGKGKSSERNIQAEPEPETEPAFNLNHALDPRGPGPGSEFGISSHAADPTINLTASDGHEVVSLLSSRTFDPEFPPSANEEPEYVETDLSSSNPQPLTQNEIEMIESFRRQIPGPAAGGVGNLNPLSLVPDIGSFLDTLPTGSSSTDPNTAQATSLRDEVLTSLPGAAEWVSVEERYHDEVWGFLKPTLEAAAKEIENKEKAGDQGSGNNEDGPAVQRLKMILRHMQH